MNVETVCLVDERPKSGEQSMIRMTHVQRSSVSALILTSNATLSGERHASSGWLLCLVLFSSRARSQKSIKLFDLSSASPTLRTPFDRLCLAHTSRDRFIPLVRAATTHTHPPHRSNPRTPQTQATHPAHSSSTPSPARGHGAPAAPDRLRRGDPQPARLGGGAQVGAVRGCPERNLGGLKMSSVDSNKHNLPHTPPLAGWMRARAEGATTRRRWT